MSFDDNFLADIKTAMEGGKSISVYLREKELSYDVKDVRQALMQKYGKEAIFTIIMSKVIR